MKVLLIDDHDLFREGMELVLTKLGSDISILNTGSYEDAGLFGVEPS